VNEVPAYCTKEARDSAELLLAELRAEQVDLITFTSSSTVKNFKAMLPDENIRDLMKGVRIASIGPITSDTAKELGFEVHITAESFTIPGLCEAILKQI